jgi:hypothetical protein
VEEHLSLLAFNHPLSTVVICFCTPMHDLALSLRKLLHDTGQHYFEFMDLGTMLAADHYGNITYDLSF